MDGVNKTLYIPLYGKAYVSRRGLFLADKKAEEIWDREGFPLKGKSASKWLAFYMGIRAAVFDSWVREKMAQMETAVVLHLGCGMDSRCLRTGTGGHSWYDVDFPEVIRERKRYYEATDRYHMIPSDVRDRSWLDAVGETDCAIVVMEGISMYLDPGELAAVLKNLTDRFDRVALLTDCYTGLAARISRYKNPINDVGVTKVYGLDNPEVLARNGLQFLREHPMTPRCYLDCLSGGEKRIFSRLYAGGFSKRLYRLFEYRKG